MKRSVDPRLTRLIEEAGDSDEVEAVVTVERGTAAEEDLDERGVGGRVLDRVVAQVHQEPSEVRFLPRLGVVYVKAKRKLIQQLLEDEEVSSATSTGSDFTVPED